jgi:hypothetical protein
MGDRESNKTRTISGTNEATTLRGITRREFVTGSVLTIAGIYSGGLSTVCSASSVGTPAEYRIAPHAATTLQKMISFPLPAKPTGPNSGTGLYLTELMRISEYGKYGYGAYTFAGGLPVAPRFDIMPVGHSANSAALTRIHQLLNFFTISDIHITDKEAPNQLLYLQQEDPAHAGNNTSICSPVMLYTTHVLDAAVQTVNALHQRKPFDFGISLGDACNSTQWNELRWYIDVIDGKVISPSSGAHLGADTIDYQRPFKAVGLDKSIPWYQVLGNHDHFWLGSVPVDANPDLGLRHSYTSGTVWAVGDILGPNVSTTAFPCMFDTPLGMRKRSFYMGVLDGSTLHGDLKDAGPVSAFSRPPRVAADPDRRSLLRAEWIREFSRPPPIQSDMASTWSTGRARAGKVALPVIASCPGRTCRSRSLSWMTPSRKPMVLTIFTDMVISMRRGGVG